MGISDDIKPKKVHRYVEHSVSHPKNAASTESKTTEPEKEVDDEKLLDDFYHNDPKKLEKLEDDFFEQKNKKEINPEEHGRQHRPVKRFIILILIFALVALIIYQNFDIIKSYFLGTTNKTTGNSSSEEQTYTGETGSSTATTTPSITTEEPAATTATTTPAPQSFTIEVLNGNGVTGSADKIKETLITAGFEVAKVANAKSFSYQSTYVYYKTGKEAEATSVKSALSARTCLLEESNTVAKTYDVVVVAGKN